MVSLEELTASLDLDRELKDIRRGWREREEERVEKQTLEALQGSIRKWDGIAKGKMKDMGTRNCPLCTLFYDEDYDLEYVDEGEGAPRICGKCPVALFTEEDECTGSPYYAFLRASSGGWARSALAIGAAKFERQFLANLLPRGVTPETYREKKSDSSSPVPNADRDTVQAGVSGGGSR